jgi:hypothetical protein
MTRDEALVMSLQFQRNALADQLASTLADLEVAKARIEQLEAAHERLAALEGKIAELDESNRDVNEAGQVAAG